MGFLKSKKQKRNFSQGLIYGAGLSVGMYVAEKAIAAVESIPKAVKSVSEKNSNSNKDS